MLFWEVYIGKLNERGMVWAEAERNAKAMVVIGKAWSLGRVCPGAWNQGTSLGGWVLGFKRLGVNHRTVQTV